MIDCVVDSGALLGECPVWSGAENVLYWIDIDGKAVHRFDPGTGIDEARVLPARPGSIALTSHPGRLLVAMEHQLGWFEWDGEGFRPWVDIEPAGNGSRLNDGRSDPVGRFWVGSMFEDVPANRFRGTLYRVESSGSVTEHQHGVGVSNGLAFSPDGATMYWADTLRNTVWAFDYNVDSGEASSQRVFLEFDDLPGQPDGGCVDGDACYWVACVHGGAVARITPAGDVDRVVEVPASRPTMLAFGGPSLDTLYVTTIGDRGTDEHARSDPHPGGLFAFTPGTTGTPEPAFAGSP